MLKSFLRIAFRNLLNPSRAGYTLINVVGLAVGMASCVLILLYVQDELSYDRYHEKADRIYRVTLHGVLAGNPIDIVNTSAPMAATLKADYPEVEASTRLFKFFRSVLISREDKAFNEELLFYADSSYFDVFSLPLLQGEQKTALNQPNSMVITEDIAGKYFGKEPAVGKTLTINNGGTLTDYRVTGVCENIPANSHFHFDFLASMTSLNMSRSTRWISNNNLTYIALREGANAGALETKLPKIVQKYIAPQIKTAMGFSYDEFRASGGEYGFRLQKLTDIHLYSNLDGEIEANGNAAYIVIFSIIAAFILLLACVNFMNLATARSAGRAKEVGVRKAVGSQKKQLIHQFLLEAFVLSGTALVLAVLLAAIALPVFNNLAAKQLSADYLTNPTLIIGLLAITIGVGLAAGAYPAFFLASFKPVEVLKGKLKMGAKSGWLRSSLVVFQFSISMILLIGTFTVKSQLQYIGEKELGFDKEQVIIIDRANSIGNRLDAFENAVAQLPEATLAARSIHLPGRGENGNVYVAQDAPVREGYLMNELMVGYDFVETLSMGLMKGRAFSRDYGTDSLAILVNEAAVREFGWDEPLGKTMTQPDEGGQSVTFHVIGVVKDFHYRSLHNQIRPAVMVLNPSARFVAVKVKPGEAKNAVAALQNVWQDFAPNEPFQYSFFDDDFDKMYRADQRVGQVFGVFAGLGVFIACLGLFGLASFSSEQRTKEIGVRKVLGASVASIFILMAREFTRLVAVAWIISAAVGFFAMQSWLNSFAYRTSLSPTIFLLAGALALSLIHI